MGAASSVDLHAELARPADASDVETNDEARAEVARLRAMIATQLAAGAIPSSRIWVRALIPGSSGIKVLTRTGRWVLGINVWARLPFPLHLKKVSGGGEVRGTMKIFHLAPSARVLRY